MPFESFSEFLSNSFLEAVLQDQADSLQSNLFDYRRREVKILPQANFNSFQLVGCHGANSSQGAENRSGKSNIVFGKLFNFENSANVKVAELVRKTRTFEKYQQGSVCLLLGDNFYSDGLRSADLNNQVFKENFRDLGLGVSFPILGNHDWGVWNKGKSKEGHLRHSYEKAFQTAYNQILLSKNGGRERYGWYMPARYYYINHPFADFFCIDSTTFAFDINQQEWLRKLFQSKKDNNKLKILVSHHPLVSIGKRNSLNKERSQKTAKDAAMYRFYFGNVLAPEGVFNKGLPDSNLTLNEILYELLAGYPFDIILSAHDHCLAGYHIQLKNMMPAYQIISGAGGAKLEGLDKFARDYEGLLANSPLMDSKEFYAGRKEYGYVKMNINRQAGQSLLQKASVEFKFYYIDARNKPERIIEIF